MILHYQILFIICVWTSLSIGYRSGSPLCRVSHPTFWNINSLTYGFSRVTDISLNSVPIDGNFSTVVATLPLKKKAAAKKSSGTKKSTKKSRSLGEIIGVEASRSARECILVIVESPAKARTIQKFIETSIGEEYIIEFCAGHIRDFPTAKAAPTTYKKQMILQSLGLNVGTMGVDVFNKFQPLYAPIPGKRDLIARLKDLSKTATRVLLATDEDREGEAISWHLVEALDLENRNIPYKRAVFHEITQSAIVKSFNSPREIDMDLVHAQEARRIMDRLAGFTLSPILWRYVIPGLSAGRVQSCGLHLITERERKRWRFVPSQYYSMEARISSSSDGNSENRNFVQAKLYSVNNKKAALEKDFDENTGDLKGDSLAKGIVVLNKTRVDHLVSFLTEPSTEFRVSSIDSKSTARRSPPPFITSSLQQEASYKLGISPSLTMSVAQKLYEEGHITYMRTDSPTLSSEALKSAKDIVRKDFGDNFLVEVAGRVASSASSAPKNAQEAHEAIRPTISNGIFKYPRQTGLEGLGMQLYELIYRRTVASVMAASQTVTTTYSITADAKHLLSRFSGDDIISLDDVFNSINEVGFRASSSYLKFEGFLAVYNRKAAKDMDADHSSGIFNEGQQLYLSPLTLQPDDFRYVSNSDGAASDGTIDADILATGPIVSSYLTADENSLSLSSTSQSNIIGNDIFFSNSTIPTGLSAVEHTTRASSRFTEASFIKELESIGVGRPSTYSKIFQVLQDRDYVIVDKHTIIPTLKGILVSSLLEKHFPDIVNSDFTAQMENSLDQIAKGQVNKEAFLSDFYLGKSNNKSEGIVYGKEIIGTTGLLPLVQEKIENNAIDHSESRTLDVPFLKNVAQLKFSKYGAFIEELPSPEVALLSRDQNIQTSSEYSAIEKPLYPNTRRWKLPDIMQNDLRQLSRESIISIMENGVDANGSVLGIHPGSQKVAKIKSGRFGKYLQIGEDDDKDKSTCSLPEWVSLDVARNSVEDILAFADLPKRVAVHKESQVPILLKATQKGLNLVLDGYSKWFHLPGVTSISQVSEKLALEVIGDDISEILNSQRMIGDFQGSPLVLRKGRYGWFIRWESLMYGLKKSDPDFNSITLQQCGELILENGRAPGYGKKKAKKKSTAKVIKAAIAKKEKVFKKKRGDKVSDPIPADVEIKKKVKVAMKAKSKTNSKKNTTVASEIGIVDPSLLPIECNIAGGTVAKRVTKQSKKSSPSYVKPEVVTKAGPKVAKRTKIIIEQI